MYFRELGTSDSVVAETTEYRCFQSQFSVLYNACMLLKTMLKETRHTLHNSKNNHLRQIEIMESDELINQKKLRSEVIVLEDALAQTRNEFEMLRIEAANEPTGPINREMKHLIKVHRFKRKYKETNAEIPKLKKQIEELQSKRGQSEVKTEITEELPKQEESSTPCEVVKEEQKIVKQEPTEKTNEAGALDSAAFPPSNNS